MLKLCPGPNRIDEGSFGDFKKQPGTARFAGQLGKEKGEATEKGGDSRKISITLAREAEGKYKHVRGCTCASILVHVHYSITLLHALGK